MKNFNSTYISSYRFLLIKTQGTLTMGEFEKMIYQLPNYLNTISQLNVLLDLSYSLLCLKYKDLDSLFNLLINKIPIESFVRIALIINGYSETAYAILFREDIIQTKNIDMEIFTRYPAALCWLQVN